MRKFSILSIFISVYLVCACLAFADNQTPASNNSFDNTQERIDKQETALTKARAGMLYQQALSLYRHRKYAEARDGFASVEKLTPGYKSTRAYLKYIDRYMAKQQQREQREKQRILEKQRQQEQEFRKKQEEHQEWVEGQKAKEQAKPGVVTNQPVQEPPPKATPVKDNKIQQVEEVQLLGELARKSSMLYQQISALADDRSTVIAKKKLARTEEVLSNLEQEKQKALIQMRENEQRRHQQELKEKDKFRLQQAQQAYDEAINLLRTKDFDGAKKKFLEVETIQPNFKSTHDYLSNINQNRDKVQQEAFAEKTREDERKSEEEREKVREQEIQKNAQDQQQHKEKQIQERQQLAQIARQAANINDDILKSIKAKDYLGAKAKFDELETTMENLKDLKEIMSHEKEEENLAKLQAKQQQQMEQEKQRILKEKHLFGDSKQGSRQETWQAKEAQLFKEKENRRQREIIFRQGLDLYRAKKYPAAKIIFADLASQGDSRANPYLKKIDRLIHEDVIKANNYQERERSDYLADRLRQQRLKSVIEIQQRQRQKQLTQELEKQKKIFEQERQQEQRRIQMLRTEERQWQRLDAQRQHMEAKVHRQKEEYHFRKVQPASVRSSQVESQSHVNVSSSGGFKHVTPVQNGQSKEDLRKQKEEARKKLEEQRKQEADQKDKDRQKKTQDLKDKKKQEIKQKEEARKKEAELLRQKAEQKEKESLEKHKAQEQAHLEEQHKIELEKDLEERQKKLEEERRVIHQQLNNGVEAIYRNALRLYRSGDYQAAAVRFSDVQDLIPNYKNAGEYLKKSQARNKSATSLPVVSKTLASPEAINNPQNATKSAQKDELSKALDLFETNNIK